MDASTGPRRPQCRRKKHALREFQEKSGTVVRSSFENGTQEDIAAIERQLGFVPTNVISVASRAESGPVQ